MFDHVLMFLVFEKAYIRLRQQLRSNSLILLRSHNVELVGMALGTNGNLEVTKFSSSEAGSSPRLNNSGQQKWDKELFVSKKENLI